MEIFKFTKDGSHIIMLHSGIQQIQQEQLYIHLLQQQLLISKKVADVSKDFFTSIKPDSIRLCVRKDSVSQCQEDIHSIFSNTEANITVITKFLSGIELEKVSSGPLISHVLLCWVCKAIKKYL